MDSLLKKRCKCAYSPAVNCKFIYICVKVLLSKLKSSEGPKTKTKFTLLGSNLFIISKLPLLAYEKKLIIW